jgi:Zn ribbon nucleic-acid-binding protein
MNCVAGESTNLIEGKILDESGGAKPRFKPLEVSMWKAVFGIGVQEVTVFACVHCGHRQMSVNFSDEDRQRYLELEGQQPDLLERIESQ